MGLILPLPQVAFDEAGNTGPNLLDPDQPVFALASVLATDDVEGISGGARELKFSRLRRSAAGRAEILRVLNHGALRDDVYLVSGFHKRFMAVTKIVDLLYEPMAHADGIDLYERGANLAMANLLFHTLPVFIGPALFDQLLESFVTMVRDPTDGHINAFFRIVHRAYAAASSEDLKDELGALLASRTVVEFHRDSFDGTSLDPAIPSFFMNASEWTNRLETPFEIIHDPLKPMAREQLVLEAMMSTSEPPATIGYDRRKMAFPLAATGIRFEHAADEPALQVADIIASAVAYAMRSIIEGNEDGFAEKLLETRVLQGRWAPVWPELKFTPQELGTDEPAPRIDPHDYVGGYVSDRLGGIPPPDQRRKPPRDEEESS